MRVLLIGQPNVGKSSLLGALTGAKVMVSNYPGTTVDVSQGRSVIRGKEYTFVDTPGAYSLNPSSEEEKVADRMVLEGDYAFAIQIVDATSLERNLIMTLQLAELGVPLIVALNFWEEAQKKGTRVDIPLLSEALGVPVVRINPVRGRLGELVSRLDEARAPTFSFSYDDHIEMAIEELLTRLSYRGGLSRRGIAVKLLEGDPVATELFGFPGLAEIREGCRKEHPRLETDILVTRAGFAALLGERVQRIAPHGARLNWLDRLIINSPGGDVVFTLAVFAVIFVSLLYIGGWLQDLLGGLFDSLSGSIQPWLGNQSRLVQLLIGNSLIGLAAGISVAVPYIGIFYFILALLEDSGLLSRFVVALNRVMGRLGLPGKAIIPIMLGLGCTVPAIRATRVLPNFRDRLKVAILYLTIPCSSRNGVIFGVVGHSAGAVYAIGIYLAALLVFLVTAKALKVALPQEGLPLVEELPPYRRPVLGNLLVKAWVRMKDFVYIVIPLLIAGGMLYGVLLHLDLVRSLVGPFRFLTVGWLGLPAETIVPLIYGFLQKDLVPAMLASALGTVNFSSAMTGLQLFTFGLASTFQIPCVIAFAMLAREFGPRRAVLVEVAAFVYGMLWAGVLARALSLFLR